MAISVVAFDLMETVVRDPFREALTESTGLTVEGALARRDPGSWPAFERGELTEREFFATFDGVTLDEDVFHHVRREGYVFIGGMTELLDDLAGEVRRVVASNYPVWIEELAEGLLHGRFDRVLASHHLGVRKPAAEFYERLCAEIDVPPGEVLFVDDREENVEGARRAGLLAHHFDGSVEALRRRLRAEGILV